MQAYTYVEKGKFALLEKPKQVLLHERDAIVKLSLIQISAPTRLGIMANDV